MSATWMITSRRCMASKAIARASNRPTTPSAKCCLPARPTEFVVPASAGRARFGRREPDFELLGMAERSYSNGAADPIFGEQLVELIDAGDWLAVETDDDIAFAQARLGRWAPRFN